MESTRAPTLYLLPAARSEPARQRLRGALRRDRRRCLSAKITGRHHLFADDLKTIEDYGRLSARLRAAMGPHIVDILRHGLSVVLDFPANTVKQRSWMRSLIVDADVAHELHWLDIPDAVCMERLRNRNAGGEHPFQVSDAEYAQFTRYFRPAGI